MQTTNMHQGIRITEELDVLSDRPLKRRGLKLVCHRTQTDGAYVYSATERARAWVRANYDCHVENRHGGVVLIRAGR